MNIKKYVLSALAVLALGACDVDSTPWKLAVKGQTVTLKYREVLHAKQHYKWETLKLIPPAEKT